MPIEGLYAITPDFAACDSSQLMRLARLALDGGAKVLQYRRKDVPLGLRKTEVQALRELCRDVAVPFIVNDDVELALDVGADGVHLGRDDVSVAQARVKLGTEVIVGASCYDDVELAHAALEDGANYVAFGSFFPSVIKPHAVRPTTQLLRRARAELRCPIVAIGGITRTNAATLIDAGADAVAVITDLFMANDVRESAAQFAALFARSRTHVNHAVGS